MTKPHLTTNRDRLSKRYLGTHMKLMIEVRRIRLGLLPLPEITQDKSGRKRQASQSFRQTGE